MYSESEYVGQAPGSAAAWTASDPSRNLSRVKTKRYCVSVSRRTHELLRERVADPHAFVEEVVASALADPELAAGVVQRIHDRAACGRIADPDCF